MQSSNRGAGQVAGFVVAFACGAAVMGLLMLAAYSHSQEAAPLSVPTVAPTAIALPTMNPSPIKVVQLNPSGGGILPTAVPTGHLTLEKLRNGLYYLVAPKDRPIRLKDGAGVPYPEKQFTGWVRLNPTTLVWGDLNGDQVNDAAVELVYNGGGNMDVGYVALVLDVNGEPFHVGSIETSGVTELSIDRGILTVGVRPGKVGSEGAGRYRLSTDPARVGARN